MNPKTSEKSPDWGFHAAMLTGAALLVSSGYAGAHGVRAASGGPGAPSSGGRPPCYGARLTAPRISSLWSANSAQAITMIAMVTMPVIVGTAPCVALRVGMPLTQVGSTHPGRLASMPESWRDSLGLSLFVSGEWLGDRRIQRRRAMSGRRVRARRRDALA